MSRTATRLLVLVAIVTGAAALGWWAGTTVASPPEDPIEPVAEIEYTVAEGEVGRSLSFGAVAEWDRTLVGRNQAPGVVTEVVADGTPLAAGAVTARVDLRPVVVAQGDVPMFRDLARRASGPDVVQLQALLTELGFYAGELDGVFGAGVRSAVQAWQDSMGVEDDGVVRRGDLVFVPELPARLVVASDLEVGTPLSGGEPLLFRLAPAPVFAIRLAPEQRDVVPLDADVRVAYPDGVWDAVIASVSEPLDEGILELALTAPDGGPVCGDECAEWVAIEGRTVLGAEIVVEPTVAGPVVPGAAIRTRPDGAPYVVLDGGAEQEVTVLGASDGLAVVDGVEAGDVVILSFDPTEAP